MADNPGFLSIGLTEAFFHVMTLRENADNRSHYSKSGAERILKNAEEFLICAREILVKK
jgi:hypothetical protein